MERKKESEIVWRLKALIQRDLLYTIVIIFCLAACIYTLLHVDSYVQDCNEQWQNYTKDYCTCGAEKKEDWHYGIEDTYKNAEWSGWNYPG